MTFNGKFAKAMNLHRDGNVAGAISVIRGESVTEGHPFMDFYNKHKSNGEQPLVIYSRLCPD